VNPESRLIGSIANHLVLVDGVTGRATDLGTVGDFDQIESITSANGALYGIVHTTSSPKVISIDPLSMQATHFVTITVPGETITFAEAMAFCPEDGLLYVAAGEYPYSDILITVHPATGDITELADIIPAVSGNPADADALEWVEGTLYAVDVDTNPSYLYTIDPSSGDTTSIGEIGVSYVSSLAYDPTTQTLYAISETDRQLISISLPDGQGTPIGDTHCVAVRRCNNAIVDWNPNPDSPPVVLAPCFAIKTDSFVTWKVKVGSHSADRVGACSFVSPVIFETDTGVALPRRLLFSRPPKIGRLPG
jgi:hypothetical protein